MDGEIEGERRSEKREGGRKGQEEKRGGGRVGAEDTRTPHINTY